MQRVTRRLCCLVLTCLAICRIGCAQQPERGIVVARAEADGHRIALVIGNADYAGYPLRNPVNDAHDVGALLRNSLNFNTTVIVNADLRNMDFAVRRFVAKLSPGDIGLFYFSGHGLSIEGENYLLPVDFAAISQADVKYQAYAANRVLDLMKDRGVRLSILILDACRNNPYRSWKGVGGGLANMSGEGAFIAFAAAAGETADDNPTGRNGLFTKYLLEVLQEPGLNIDEVFDRVREQVYQASQGKQVPFSYSGIIGDFYFRPAGAPIIPAEQQEIPNADLNRTQEVPKPELPAGQHAPMVGDIEGAEPTRVPTVVAVKPSQGATALPKKIVPLQTFWGWNGDVLYVYPARIVYGSNTKHGIKLNLSLNCSQIFRVSTANTSRFWAYYLNPMVSIYYRNEAGKKKEFNLILNSRARNSAPSVVGAVSHCAKQ